MLMSIGIFIQNQYRSSGACVHVFLILRLHSLSMSTIYMSIYLCVCVCEIEIEFYVYANNLLISMNLRFIFCLYKDCIDFNEKELFLIKYFSLQLSRKEIAEIYGTRHIGRDQARGLVGLMDFFCFTEVSLIINAFLHCSENQVCHFKLL